MSDVAEQVAEQGIEQPVKLVEGVEQGMDRVAPPFPDHTQLPESDGSFVKNFQEHPQSIILTDSLTAVLKRLHPDGCYAIGQDSGIYWRETDPPERGAEAPDWFYVPNVPPLLDGKYRRSYVLWREHIHPVILLEFASGDGSEERDRTPLMRLTDKNQKPGKFWVYENIICAPYYGILQVATGRLEVYELIGGQYQTMQPNDRGHYPIPQMGVELGILYGTYQNHTQPWLRWWDLDGNLLLTGWEQVELEKQQKETALLRAEEERQRAEEEAQKRRSLLDKLSSLSPEQLQALGLDLADLA